jgi:hypothetical protein
VFGSTGEVDWCGGDSGGWIRSVVTPYMLVLEPMLMFYLCSDAVHAGIGDYLDLLPLQ